MNPKKSTLLFPKDYQNHKYSLIHFAFFLQYIKISGITVELVDSSDTVFVSDDKLLFSCVLDGKQFVVDYSDHHYKNWKPDFENIPYFKFQTTKEKSKDIISLGPPIVGAKIVGIKGATMREYLHMRNIFEYSPKDKILAKQIPNGAATERRSRVHQLLKESYGELVDTDVDCDQLEFWELHKSALASICVPGATNNMADRGQTELLGLGVCTISPEIKTIFPYDKVLKPNFHYIKCNDDYSDLVDIVKKLQKDPDKSLRIGKNARRFYEKYYFPEVYGKWIIKKVLENG